MKRIILATLLVLLTATDVWGVNNSWTTSTPLIPRKLFFTDVEKTQVLLSPDGERIGYLERHGDHRQLRYVSIDLIEKPVVVPIQGDVNSWQWTYDGRIVAVAADSIANRILLCDPTSIISKDISWVTGGVYQLIASSPERPHEIVAYCRSTDSSKTGLYRVALGRDEVTRIETPVDFDRWYFDGDLRLRAGRRPTLDGMSLLRLDTVGSWVPMAEYSYEELLVPGSPNVGVMSVSRDGTELYLVDAHGSDKSCLKRVSLRTGEQSVIFRDSLADVLALGATIEPGTGSPQAVVSYFSEMRRGYLDSSIVSDFVELGKLRRGDVSFANCSVDGNRWLIRYLNGGPATYYVWDRKEKQEHFLFSDLPVLDTFPLASRSPFVVSTVDSLKLPCSVMLPPGADENLDGIPNHPLPAVLYVHGGPWLGFQRNFWLANRVLQLLANRGYAVIIAEFRGAIGYGQKFMDAGDRQWGTRMQQDLYDIVDSAISRGIASPDKVAIIGWSYGGYATMTALTQKPEKFACGVSIYGVSDLPSFCRTPFADNDFWRARVGDANVDSVSLAVVSPYRFAKAITKPLLLAHGGRDERVPAVQSQLMADTMAALGKQVTYLFYPSEVHDFRNDENWISLMATVERFLASHLGGRYESYGDAFVGTEAQLVTGGKYVDGLESEFH